MPKNVWFELPCGAMYRFKEYTFADMAKPHIIYKFPRADRDKLVNPDSTGRKRKLTSERIYGKLVRAYWKKVVERLLNGDRLVIDDFTSMYIGETGVHGDGKRIISQRKSRKYPLTDKIYGIVLNGFFHDYYFRMPRQHRQELARRIKSGQSYYI